MDNSLHPDDRAPLFESGATSSSSSSRKSFLSKSPDIEGMSFQPFHVFACRAFFLCWWIIIPIILSFIISAIYDPVGSFHQDMFPSQTIMLPPKGGRSLRSVTLPKWDSDVIQSDAVEMYRFQVPPPLLANEYFLATHKYDIQLTSSHDVFYCQDFFLNKGSTITVEWKTDLAITGLIETDNSVPCEFLATYETRPTESSPPVRVFDATSSLPATKTHWKGSYLETDISKLVSVIFTKPAGTGAITGTLDVLVNLTVFDVASPVPKDNRISYCVPNSDKDEACTNDISVSNDDSDPPPTIIHFVGSTAGYNISEYTSIRFDVLFYQKESIIGGFLVGLFIFLPLWCCGGCVLFMYNPLGRYSWYVPYKKISILCSGSDGNSHQPISAGLSQDDDHVGDGYGSISDAPSSGLNLTSL